MDISEEMQSTIGLVEDDLIGHTIEEAKEILKQVSNNLDKIAIIKHRVG